MVNTLNVYINVSYGAYMRTHKSLALANPPTHTIQACALRGRSHGEVYYSQQAYFSSLAWGS